MRVTDAIDTLGAPYPGLRSFSRDETHIFFGREGIISEAVDRLAAHRFLAVTGVSGSGKSSLVRTGLLDALDRGLLVDAGSDWRVADFRPGGRPLSHLVPKLLEALGRTVSDDELGLIEAKLARGPLGLLGWLDEIEFPDETNLLLLVDQFEEIFRYRQGPTGDDINAFVAMLLASAKQRKKRIYVVITMRSDFLGDCARFTDLAEAINDGQFLTPRLTRDQCREAIEGPAAVYGGRVEPALVTRMLNDMAGNDQLPLMQHILMLLWQQATAGAMEHPPELTLADYERSGGIGSPGPESDVPVGIGGDKPPLLSRLVVWVRRKLAGQRGSQLTAGAAAENRISNGALSDHADRVLAELTPAQQLIAAILFRALTQSEGAGGRDVRRPTNLAGIAAIAEVPVADLIPVIEAFRAPGVNFLTPPVPDPLRPDTVIDISHESLIRQWAKLRQWVREEYQSAEEYRDVERAAKQWNSGRGSLLMKLDLAVALNWRKTERPNRDWAKRYGDAFPLTMAFIRKSQGFRVRRRTIALSLPIIAMFVVSSGLIYLAIFLSAALPYIEPAGEFTDYNVKPQAVLHNGSPGGYTPRTIPGGHVIGTLALKAALKSGTIGGAPFKLIDAWDENSHKSMPNAIWIPYAGHRGNFQDDTEHELETELKKLTEGKQDMPLVFFCTGSQCWESYNACLRAIYLGYTNVLWYRGGLNAQDEADARLDLKSVELSKLQFIYSNLRSNAADVLWYVFEPIVITDDGKSTQADRQDTRSVSASEYAKRGLTEGNKADYDDAIADYTKAITLDPKNADAYYNRGNGYAKKDDNEDAVADFTKAIALDPESAIYLGKRGNAYALEGDYDSAIKDFDKAIQLNLKSFDVYFGEGFVSTHRGDYDKAIKDYSQAIQLSPGHARAYIGRGDAFFAKGDHEHAVQNYDEAIRINPDYAEAFYNRGRVYFARRDYDHAVQDFSKTITLQPGNAGAYWDRARAELYWDKPRSAAADLAAAMKLAPDNAYVVIWLHIARMRAGENDAGELAANAQKLDQAKWPWPVVALFLGPATPEAVRASAQWTFDPTTQKDQLCEADFYLGVYHGAKGERNDALQLFQSAANSCPREYVEYEAAALELDRLH